MVAAPSPPTETRKARDRSLILSLRSREQVFPQPNSTKSRMIAIAAPSARNPTTTSARLVEPDACVSTTRIEPGSAPAPTASSSATFASRRLPYRPTTVQALPSCCSRIAIRLNRANRPWPMSFRLGPGIPGGPPAPMLTHGRYAKSGASVPEG